MTLIIFSARDPWPGKNDLKILKFWIRNQPVNLLVCLVDQCTRDDVIRCSMPKYGLIIITCSDWILNILRTLWLAEPCRVSKSTLVPSTSTNWNVPLPSWSDIMLSQSYSLSGALIGSTVVCRHLCTIAVPCVITVQQNQLWKSTDTILLMIFLILVDTSLKRSSTNLLFLLAYLVCVTSTARLWVLIYNNSRNKRQK